MGPANAQDGGIAQQRHERWRAEDGAPSMIVALAQTKDGYLWIGSDDGLFRFDGITFEAVPTATANPARSSAISALAASRSGDLWVGYAGGGGVGRYHAGRLTDMRLPGAGHTVTDMAEDLDGGLWAVNSRPEDQLSVYRAGRWERIGANFGLPGGWVFDVKVTRDGSLWVVLMDRVVRLRRGARHFEAVSAAVARGGTIAQDRAGNVWLADLRGTRLIEGKVARGAPTFYPADQDIRRVRLAIASDGSLWGTTRVNGIFRIADPGVSAATDLSRFARADGLTAGQSISILADREGNVWVGTELGLDKFRRTPVVAEPRIAADSASGYGVAPDRRGEVYLLEGNQVYRAGAGSRLDLVATGGKGDYSLCQGTPGSVWFSVGGHMTRYAAGKAVQQLTVPGADTVYGCLQQADGTLWVALYGKGLMRWSQGQWRDMRGLLPQGKALAEDIVAGQDGWPIVILDRTDVLRIGPSGTQLIRGDATGVGRLTLVADTPLGLLVGGGRGLARIDHGRIQRISAERMPWAGGLRAAVPDAGGAYWLFARGSLVHASSTALSALFDGRDARDGIRLFDRNDGLVSLTQRSEGLQAALAGDGRLWLATRQAMLRVDPADIARNAQILRPVIRALHAGTIDVADPRAIDLPRGTHSFSIDYAAPSLAVPSRVRFRYRLEGVDSGWVDAGGRRQAFYTNLAPGTYRFRVIAANQDGVWGPPSEPLQITIPPTFFQTRLFLALCGVALVLLVWAIASWRMRIMARRIRAQAAERIDERERIARELHDTLLQGVQALIVRFQLVAEDIPEGSPARTSAEDALDRADDVLADGRERLLDLRPIPASADIGDVLLDIACRQGFDRKVPVTLEREGTPRPLCALVADEVARIANEALFNIWRHARASRVEILLCYRGYAFTVLIRDDGVGVPPEVLRAGGKTGHFGMSGMRERARKLQGELTIRPGSTGGTEIQLSVPGAVAYADAERRPRWWKRRRHG